MYTGLLHLHSFLRWVILLLLLISIFQSLGGMTGKKPFTSGQKKSGLFLMIAAHIQLLVGLYQYFAGPRGLSYISAVGMKDPVARFYGVEHIFGMVIAIVLITIGRGVSKKALPDAVKQKRTFWFFFLALIIILATIPWPFRSGLGGTWF